MNRWFPEGHAIHGQNFRGWTLQHVDFSGNTFHHCDFSESTISGCDFSRSVLDNCTFNRSTIQKCSMLHTRFEHTSAIGARFTLTHLQFANLRYVNFNDASFSGGCLMNSDMYVAHFENAHFHHLQMGWTKITDGHFNGARFISAKLEEVQFKDVELRGAHFEDADACGARFLYVKMQHSSWINACLRHAHFFEVCCDGAVFDRCKILGIGICRVSGKPSLQRDLNCGGDKEPLLVDDLRLAPFIHELRYEDGFGRFADALTSKVVLILGRFSDARMPLLERIHGRLRALGYIPQLIKFPCDGLLDPGSVVNIAAMCSRFVIADVSDAREVIREVVGILSQLRPVVVKPIMEVGQVEPISFVWEKRSQRIHLLPPYEYPDADTLIANLSSAIIQPCEDALARMPSPETRPEYLGATK